MLPMLPIKLLNCADGIFKARN